MDGLEERWYGEQVVLDNLAIVVYKVKYLGLCSTSTMYHTMYLRTQLVEQFLDDRSIGAGR